MQMVRPLVFGEKTILPVYGRKPCNPHSLSETPNGEQAISWEEFLSLAGGGKEKLFSLKSLSPVRIPLREENSLS